MKKIGVFATEYTLFLYMLIDTNWRDTNYIFDERINNQMVKRIRECGATKIYGYQYRKHMETKYICRVLYRLFKLRLRLLSWLAKMRKWEIIGQDHVMLARRFRELNVPFIVIEDGLLNYTSKNDWENEWKRLTNNKERYLPGGWNDSVSDIYLTGRLAIPDGLKEKVHVIDVLDAWNNLPQKEKVTIMYVFSFQYNNILSLIKTTGRDIFLLTQNYAPNSYTEKELIDIYRDILSHYDENKVIIKPHPAECIKYELFFPKCYVLREKFPFELCYLLNVPIKKIISIDSTAIYGLWNEKIVDSYKEYSPIGGNSH